MFEGRVAALIKPFCPVGDGLSIRNISERFRLLQKRFWRMAFISRGWKTAIVGEWMKISACAGGSQTIWIRRAGCPIGVYRSA